MVISKLIILLTFSASCFGEEHSTKPFKSCFFLSKNSSAVQFDYDACHDDSENSIPDDCYQTIYNENIVKNVKLIKFSGTPSIRRSDLNKFAQIFPGVLAFDISENKIKYLHFVDIKFKNLEFLNASHNQLLEIPRDLFDHIPKLIELDLSFNRMHGLSDVLFKKLTEVKVIDLRNNNIDRLHGNFDHNKKLELIKLENNPIFVLQCNILKLLNRGVAVGITWNSLITVDLNCMQNEWKITTGDGAIVFYSQKNNKDSLANRVHLGRKKSADFLNHGRIKSAKPVSHGGNQSAELVNHGGNQLAKTVSHGEIKSADHVSHGKSQSVDHVSHGESQSADHVQYDKNQSPDLISHDGNRKRYSLIHDDRQDRTSNFISHDDTQSLNLIPQNSDQKNSSTPSNHNISHELLRLSQANLQNLGYVSFGPNQLVNTLEILTLLGPSIRLLSLSGNFIGKLNATTFQRFPHLKDLYLIRTNLYEFECDPFANLTRLTNLDISENNLNKFNPKIFTKTLPRLKEFNISGNNLANIHEIIEHLGPELELLDVSRNFVESLNASTFQRFNQLFGVFLSQTNLTAFDCNPFKNLGDLKFLDISKNNFKHLNVSIFSETLKNLRGLFIGGNANLENIPEILGNLESISLLDLSENYIGQMDVDTFGRLRLIDLNLRRTNLTDFNMKILSESSFLYRLDISENHLKNANFLTEKPLEILGILFLSRNNLTELNGVTEQNYPRLKFLDVEGNPMSCKYITELKLNWDGLVVKEDQCGIVHENI